jgi:hypothetical protein
MLAVPDLHLDASTVHVDAAAVQDGATLGVDDQFIELMCADEELLRAEFDAIIAEEWAGTPPPTDPPAASSGADPAPRGPGLPRVRVATSRRPHHPGADGWSRQRSPPTRTRAHDQGTKLTTRERRQCDDWEVVA